MEEIRSSVYACNLHPIISKNFFLKYPFQRSTVTVVYDPIIQQHGVNSLEVD